MLFPLFPLFIFTSEKGACERIDEIRLKEAYEIPPTPSKDGPCQRLAILNLIHSHML